MGDPMDIFNSFFGGGGMGGQQRKRKTQDVRLSHLLLLYYSRPRVE
jgi:DnaJ-class molecular chaperone